jgi:protein-tyrosine phosphatase
MGVKGFVDIHCHMLPGLDDGPKNIEISRQMAIAAYSSGIMATVATPHCSFRFPFEPDLARRQLSFLEEHTPENLMLFLGCELQLNDESMRLFRESPSEYSLNGGRYVLVEMMSQCALPSIEHTLRLFAEKEYTPILAHPERYPALWKQPERLARWVRNGCLLQITAGALSGSMGRRAQSAAQTLLREGLVHFVASDAHDPVKRPPLLLEGFRRTAELIGVARAARLHTYNGLSVLRNEPLDLA